jgi:hypothetical protein
MAKIIFVKKFLEVPWSLKKRVLREKRITVRNATHANKDSNQMFYAIQGQLPHGHRKAKVQKPLKLVHKKTISHHKS